MKIVKSKILQKAEGRKRGKYLITLEVTDYDIEMFEDLNHTYAPVVGEKCENCKDYGFNEKYQKWLDKVWRTFWKLWNLYDD